MDTAAALQAMVAGIREDLASEEECKALAVDLEHHQMRSFQGLTCLMQLSTRRRDWVVDTLALRREVGPALASRLGWTATAGPHTRQHERCCRPRRGGV